MRKMWLIIFIPTFVLMYVVVLYLLYNKSKPATLSQTPQTVLLADIAVWYPSAPWSSPKKDTQTTLYGTVPGESIQAVITSNKASLDHFEDKEALGKMGFVPDNNLSADGPGSSVWGYTKSHANRKQIILFSYKTKPTDTNPNQPIQFSCPCETTISVFVSL